MPVELPPGTQLEPFDDAILVQQYEQKDRVKGSGLYIPDIAKEELHFARVLSVGAGRLLGRDQETGHIITMPMDLEPGQDVVFARYQGEPFKIGGASLILLRRDDIIGRVRFPEDVSDYFELRQEVGLLGHE